MLSIPPLEWEQREKERSDEATRFHILEGAA